MDIFDMFFGGGGRGRREKRTKDMIHPLRVSEEGGVDEYGWHTYIYIYIRTYIHTHIYIHTYTHTYIHTYTIHTYTIHTLYILIFYDPLTSNLFIVMLNLRFLFALSWVS